ncbi:hypothetical protein EYF80_020533 [Liparis tanakae]|uniref:Uncharacterized protein n=1 Tax=Liparis tanakae TaxID=230148 RepID=A0A4Z2HTP2_9TELE|nr:hypothetical protein EYF80_020533 [Liparis tanakae]
MLRARSFYISDHYICDSAPLRGPGQLWQRSGGRPSKLPQSERSGFFSSLMKHGGAEPRAASGTAEMCAFSSAAALSVFGLAQFMCAAGVSWELRQSCEPKPALPARRGHTSALLPYTESDKPVKSVKVGV